jgi:solute carrier family 13 (sodium-dependent dicarboxylate transporter), member 2/3/5
MTKTMTADPAAGTAHGNHSILGILGACAALVVILSLPTPAGMTIEAQRTAALFAFGLVLWSTEALPIGATCLLTLILQPILNINPVAPALINFMSPVFFFVLVMFIIAHAWIKTGLARRFALWMISRAGTDSKRVLCVFIIGTGLISTFISDVPCSAIFMAIALGIFQKLGIKQGSTFGKAVMLGIPIGSFIGGVGTPAGSAINVLGLAMMEQNGAPRVPFLSWMVIGLPMVAIMLPVACFVLMKYYPPEIETIGDMSDIQKERHQLGPISANECKVMVIMGAMMVAWILGTWYPTIFDTFLVGIAGACVMFLPGMNLFTWKEVQDATGWDTLLMIGAVTSLGAVSTKTGLAKWLVDTTMGGLHDMSLVALLLLISAFTVAMHLVLPVNPAIIAAIVPPMMLLGKASGVNPAIYGLPVVFTTSCAFLLPLDPVALVTYSKGYYRVFDMFVPGLIISIVWIFVMTGLLRVLGPALGLM